jgi:hypothetical protein
MICGRNMGKVGADVWLWSKLSGRIGSGGDISLLRSQ